jgi:hypothetical protein
MLWFLALYSFFVASAFLEMKLSRPADYHGYEMIFEVVEIALFYALSLFHAVLAIGGKTVDRIARYLEIPGHKD